jgi:hypothetical protein
MREQEWTWPCRVCTARNRDWVGVCVRREGMDLSCRVCTDRSRDWVGVCEGGGMDFAC